MDCALLAKRSKLSQPSLTSLIHEALLDEETLLAIAPYLHLNPEALMAIARRPFSQELPLLPRNFTRFTTSYHKMEVHSYLLWSETNRTAIAFDTGTDLTPLLQQLQEHQLHLSTVFLTHHHTDHICQLKELLQHTGATAWIEGNEVISDTQPLPQHYHYQLDNMITIEARATPGHSPGGTTYVVHGLSPMIAIVGDAIFAGSVGGIPSLCYQDALHTIQKQILALPDDTVIAPGHGPLTTVKNETSCNPFFTS